MQCLFDSVGKIEFFAEPFPHVVIKGALEDALCDRLIAKFPSIDVIAQGAPVASNERFSYPTQKYERVLALFLNSLGSWRSVSLTCALFMQIYTNMILMLVQQGHLPIPRVQISIARIGEVSRFTLLITPLF